VWTSSEISEAIDDPIAGSFSRPDSPSLCFEQIRDSIERVGDVAVIEPRSIHLLLPSPSGRFPLRH
jgi:hypothetical protein